ncbi:Chromo domain-like protein [Artemisia annua]|uniref:Chromo domain-like protein n=1 Tax=Artemisia annua TaxID=35608 RepID=A0A2U1PMD3_ARTAN|nr:Chromo domain-like protein [Artemisia annua]
MICKSIEYAFWRTLCMIMKPIADQLAIEDMQMFYVVYNNLLLILICVFLLNRFKSLRFGRMSGSISFITLVGVKREYFLFSVQKSEIRKNEWKYFVHYLGWSKTWDEWVTADRLMKTTEENIQKQKALDKKQGLFNDHNGKFVFSNLPDIKVEKEDVKSNGAKGKKRKNDSSTEGQLKTFTKFPKYEPISLKCVLGVYFFQKEIASVEKVVDIQIPSTLKKLLVDDWEFINKQDKFVKLPRSPNVDEILKEYLEYRSKKDDMMADSDKEILNGLRCYFDRALPIILLYSKERKQYCESVKKDVSPSCIYGAEHLLRLFVKLPELLRYVHIEEEVLTCLQEKFHDFLKFLEKKHSSFFVSSYAGSIKSED